MRPTVPVLAALALLAPAVCMPAISTAPANDPTRSCFLIRTNTKMRNGANASGNGTGFLVDTDLVLTCNHLMRIPTPFGLVNAQQINVQTAEDQYTPATIVAKDVDHDLVLLKLAAPVSSCAALQVQPFSLEGRDGVKIVGNFPDRVRTTSGKLILPLTRDEFALSSAKVYSGFSGGPVLNSDGVVQGILSQRDDANNSIFLRSDVLCRLLQQYSQSNNRQLACFQQPERATKTTAANPTSDLAALPARKATAPTNRSAAATAKSEVPRRSIDKVIVDSTKAAAPRAKTTSSDTDEVIIAVPVRKTQQTHYTSGSDN